MASVGPPLDPEATPILVVRVAAALAGSASVAEVAERLPEPSGLNAGSWIAVEPEAPERPSLFGRLMRKRAAVEPTGLAVRCTALLARGFADVCAHDGVAYGRTRATRPSGGLKPP